MEQTATSTDFVRRLCDAVEYEYRPEGFTLWQVSALLSKAEYVATPDDLSRLVQRGRVSLDFGEPWGDFQIHQAAANLEAGRRWLFGSKLHRLKKSTARVTLEENGDHELRKDAAKYPIRELLLFLTEAEQRPIREAFLETVMLKLQELDINPDD